MTQISLQSKTVEQMGSLISLDQSQDNSDPIRLRSEEVSAVFDGEM